MPTAAKLVAAICLALLAVATGELVKTLMPASTDFGYFTIVNALLGVIVGWTVIGSRAGRGMAAAISNGITGTAALVFWALFVQATNEMVSLSLERQYKGPVEAIGGIFELIVDFGAYLVDLRVMVMLVSGAIVSGWLTEIAASRWR